MRWALGVGVQRQPVDTGTARPRAFGVFPFIGKARSNPSDFVSGQVPEVCRIFCATANPTEVIVAETAQGRAILGVVDGFKAQGVEDETGIAWRKQFLRQIGYKVS